MQTLSIVSENLENKFRIKFKYMQQHHIICLTKSLFFALLITCACLFLFFTKVPYPTLLLTKFDRNFLHTVSAFKLSRNDNPVQIQFVTMFSSLATIFTNSLFISNLININLFFFNDIKKNHAASKHSNVEMTIDVQVPNFVQVRSTSLKNEKISSN